MDEMTDAELRCMREYLGVTGEWLADRLGVEGRTVRRWEAGTSIVPDGVRAEIADLIVESDVAVDALVRDLGDAAQPVVVVYRTDQPDAMPAGWYRRIAARASREAPHVTIVYEEYEE